VLLQELLTKYTDMAFISFISETYLKTFAPINNNVDINDLTPHLESTELMFTRELLGKDVYDDLKTKFIAQTLNLIETDLVVILKEAIAYRCAEQAIPFIATKIRNSGVVKLTGENYQAAALVDVKYLRSELANKAEFYEQRVVNYICNYKASFPLYAWSNKNDPSPNMSTPYDSDIAFDHDTNTDLRKRYWYGD